MSLETEVQNLTTQTTALLNAVNTSKATLDNRRDAAAASAAAAADSAANAETAAALVFGTFGGTLDGGTAAGNFTSTVFDCGGAS